MLTRYGKIVMLSKYNNRIYETYFHLTYRRDIGKYFVVLLTSYECKKIKYTSDFKDAEKKQQR